MIELNVTVDNLQRFQVIRVRITDKAYETSQDVFCFA